MTFGNGCDQSLEKASLPSGLQTLTFGECFDQSLEHVTLPSGLQTPPSSLQNLLSGASKNVVWSRCAVCEIITSAGQKEMSKSNNANVYLAKLTEQAERSTR